MIKIDQLTKYFDEYCAVKDLSFTVNEGEVIGFLGPNGAGKSTTMKMLTGFLEASSGTIEICGLNIEHHSLQVKQLIGYLPEGAPAYGDMTPAQFLNFIADVRGLTGAFKAERIKKVIADVELQSVLHRPIENLSKGFKRRVGLAQAIIHDPKVLILDEPTDGLDPNQKHHVRKLIQNLSKDKIVIVSTHILEEVTAVCNRAVIIASGQKLFDGTPEALRNLSKYQHAVTVELAHLNQDVDSVLALEGVESIELNGDKLTIFPEKGAVIFHRVFEFIQTNNWRIETIYAEKGRLDDVFRDLTVDKNQLEEVS
ncbi:ABC transporter ATP-binding protein [Flocculibacter collagenilyticus]|uniref:ABC transporter ATP-binding protein n=1 Tax=Flocculibacter collagenilyticus TaxID=2744479 RepID=UPI0018F7753F|nr:ATP-binding cassette domain-containing protein [Flocculibacter collagenilyticus]